MTRKTRMAVRHPLAVLDIAEIADFIAARSGLDASDRFIAAVQKTAEVLSRMPAMGIRWESDNPHLAGLRYFPVTRFPNHLIFYRSLDSGIEVVRVLHGAA